MWGQLELWKERATMLAELVHCEEAEKKIFKPKDGLLRLCDYKSKPGVEFWRTFPVNRVLDKPALINGEKLYRLACSVGIKNMERLEMVCKDLREGADIGCRGSSRAASRSSNAPSAFEHPEHVTDAIATWVVKEFVYGPVEECEVPTDAKVNGIMCREKPDGSVRIILNMSSPTGNCVNEGIDNSQFPAEMSSTRKWLAVLGKAGRQCQIMKLDWSDAYKHLKVRKEDLGLQWFSWLGAYFAELCLIFGTSSSVGIYDRAAKTVLEVVLRISRFPEELVCQHLDDVCAAAAAGSAELSVFSKTYRSVAEQIGVKLAPLGDPDKAFEPCTAGTVLGVHYDTMTWTWSIPRDKMLRLIKQIQDTLEQSAVKQVEVWSLVGRILHYAPLVPTGRFNVNHLIKANSESTDRGHMVEMTADFKRQLFFWHLMIRVTSGLAKIPDELDKFPAWTVECYTDAAGGTLEGVGRGAGCVTGPWWAYVAWGRRINAGVKAEDGKKLSRKLSALELVGPLICVSAGSSWCRSRHVRVWVDNFGSVKIWEKGYSNQCGLCTTLVKAIGTVAAGLGCHFTIQKITRCSSTGAVLVDQLSKANFNEFRRTAGEAGWALDVAPAGVPVAILSWIAQPCVDEELGQRILAEIGGATPVLH